MRVQTGAGFSPYSNEVTVTTLQALPAAPTNLQATATSSSQVNLTWTNNAPNATAIRVESQPAGSANFSDVGTAATLSSAAMTNLQPNTTYTFRVRAQNIAGYSGYSNVATATTLPVLKSVFLIHGLDQGPLDMRDLAFNLASSYGLTPGRFKVDYGFDFSDCADKTLASCSANCTIPGGAQRLAQYIVNANPPGDVVLIGFSLGGLIARDMIVNNRIILNGRKIHLVMIGTPNLGYPYLATDSLVFCSAIVSAMDGNWRSQPGSIALSSYLLSLTNQWSAYGFPGSGRTWLAASGRACNVPTRLTTGCRDQNKYSDGVVCQDSAAYNVSTSAGTLPNQSWADPNGVYYHSSSGFTALILCNTSGLDPTRYFPLYDPPPTPGGLFGMLTTVLNGM
jgi:pimeloyl-ACP methyl ester carboxylesterase